MENIYFISDNIRTLFEKSLILRKPGAREPVTLTYCEHVNNYACSSVKDLL